MLLSSKLSPCPNWLSIALLLVSCPLDSPVILTAPALIHATISNWDYCPAFLNGLLASTCPHPNGQPHCSQKWSFLNANLILSMLPQTHHMLSIFVKVKYKLLMACWPHHLPFTHSISYIICGASANENQGLPCWTNPTKLFSSLPWFLSQTCHGAFYLLIPVMFPWAWTIQRTSTGPHRHSECRTHAPDPDSPGTAPKPGDTGSQLENLFREAGKQQEVGPQVSQLQVSGQNYTIPLNLTYKTQIQR